MSYKRSIECEAAKDQPALLLNFSLFIVNYISKTEL